MSRDTVLIIAPEDDVHAQAVAKTLEESHRLEVIIWNSGSFPEEDTLTLTIDGEHTKRLLKASPEVDVSSLRSVWWRRPKRHQIAEVVADNDVRSYCERESAHAFKGILLSAGVPIVNDPVAESAAELKPRQLIVASRIGLTVPRTIISNDPEEINEFYANLGGDCIYKALTAPTWKLVETRPLEADLLDDLDSLSHAPIIVQERISKKADIRATVIGSKVFAATVQTEHPEAALDWRLDLTARWQEYDLPPSVETMLVDLIAELGLYYGCIDLRETPEGEYVFLEVNPSGQFLFVEIDTGQPISDQFADLLSNPLSEASSLPVVTASPL